MAYFRYLQACSKSLISGRRNETQNHIFEMRNWLLIIPFIAASLVGLSQSRLQIDSLQHLLATSKEPRERAFILVKLSESFLNQNSDSTLRYADEAFVLGRQVGDERTMALAQRWQAIAVASKGDFEKSLTLSFEALKRFEALQDNTQMAWVKSNMAGTYYQFGNYGLALTQALESQQIALALKDTALLVSTGTFIGSVYSDVKNYREAIHALKEVIKLRPQNKFEAELSYTFYNLGNAYASSGSLDSALTWYQKSSDIAKRVADFYLYQITLVKLADIHIALRDYNKAEKLLTDATTLANEKDFQEIQPERFLALVDLYFQQGKTNRAFNIAWHGNQYVKKFAMGYFEYEFAIKLAELHRTQKRYDSAFFYLQRVVSLRDSIDQSTDFNKVANWNFDYQMRQREANERKLLANLNLEHQLAANRGTLLTFALGAILVLLIMSILIWRLYRHRATLSQLLQTRNQELDHSLQQVNNLNMGMRGMMAQVTHDLRSPLNRVQGLLQLIGKVNTEEDKEELIQISLSEVKRGRAFVDNLLKSTSYNEWIPEWSEFDMAELVREIIARFDQASQEKNVSILADLHSGSVRSDRLAVDRILDNLLSNAIKYSPTGSTVSCSLSHHANDYTLRVADKGPGFTEEDQKKMFTAFQRLSAKPTGGESSFGVGLSSVNDLVKVLKGSIELKTSANLGSEFIIKLPKHPPEHKRVLSQNQSTM